MRMPSACRRPGTTPAMPEQVEVWSAAATLPPGLDATALAALLAEDERARLAGFRFDADATAYLLAHALRRLVLARRLGCTPAELVFRTGPRGAVALDHPQAQGLQASLSRSRAGVAVALADAAVGVDLEAVEASRADFELLAPWLRWEAGPPTSEPAEFFRHWTALEAFWKAMGVGLAQDNPPLRCETAGEDILLRFATGEDALAGRARQLDAGPGAALAVATRGAAPPRVVHHRIADARGWQRLQRAPAGAADLPP